MTRIVPEIATVEQHQQQVQNNPGAYRPSCCPHCVKSVLHHHGHYERNTPKGEGLSLSGRLFSCCRCHTRSLVCSSCDHGQRYCADECRHEARTESTKRATKKYQSTRTGRFKNA